jgi:hypothetical protein
VAFAVGIGEVATPFASLTAVTLGTPPKLAEAPVAGAVKVTVTPLTGVPTALVTVAESGAAKAVPCTVLCPVPPLAAMARTLEVVPLADSAAPSKVTLPVPELMTQLTVSVCPAEPAA